MHPALGDSEEAVYPVKGPVPTEAGPVQATVAVPSPAVATTAVGGPGALGTRDVAVVVAVAPESTRGEVGVKVAEMVADPAAT